MARKIYTDGILGPGGIKFKFTTGPDGLSTVEDRSDWVLPPTFFNAAAANSFLQEGDLLIANIRTTSSVGMVDISNLDIVRDGNVYDFEMFIPYNYQESLSFNINNNYLAYYSSISHQWTPSQGSFGNSYHDVQHITIPINQQGVAMNRIRGTIMFAENTMSLMCESSSISRSSTTSRIAQTMGIFNEAIPNVTSVLFQGFFPVGTVVKFYRR